VAGILEAGVAAVDPYTNTRKLIRIGVADGIVREARD